MKYTNVSQLYDATYSVRTGDLQFYKEYIEEQKLKSTICSVIEIGAGTGRVLLPIACNNQDIVFTAVDVISDELEVLKEKASAKGIKNIETVASDINDYKPEEQFDIATAPFRVLQHCLSTEGMDKFFKNVNDMLMPNGKFVFDLFNPSIPMLGKTGEIFSADYTDEEGNKIFRRVDVNERDHFAQTQKVEEYYDVHYTNAATDKFEWIYQTRYYFKDEVVPLLKQNRFDIEAIYGSFDKQAYGQAPYPGEMIFICSKINGPQ